MLRNHKRLLFIIVFSMVIMCTFKISFASPDVYEISNFEELVNAAELTRQSGHQTDKFILTKDIVITEEDQQELLNSDFTYISFGSSDYPFKGVFDGQGYSISNLKYEETAEPKTDTGLFSYTGDGAIIKNLTIINADIDADYRGGLVAGYSEGTVFENITIKDSHLFVAAANNVLSLITDGGIRGGAIVGEANNSVLYNCESINTMVNTNNTAGVAALSGKGLYLGGLVGTSNSTEVEYSRVEGGLVKIYYDVAVGALGGNTLYVGGIIGQMNGTSKVIDSYSTTELNFYCATYVSVGAGNTGHIGGITGAMFGNGNEIIRSHYAGKATSEQYNSILVIPTIQKNVNISGITNVYEGGKVENTYFKPSLNPDVDMKVLGNSDSTSSYGPLSDENYIDKNFWKSENYDLHGNIIRNTKYNSNHVNKWIIDPNEGILKHGSSIAATFDFEGAGEVTISKTELVDEEVSTKNPYSFAIQGIKPTENKVTIKAKANEGYRFVSWYKIEDSIIDSTEENHLYFDTVFKNEPYKDEATLENNDIKNNDLFVAYYQAKVVFHDIEGNIIDPKTGKEKFEITDNDWYDYEDEINCETPLTKPNSSNAKLIGWTTIKSNEKGGGYSSITTPELISLKNQNEFYETGDKITKTMNLYPVYVDSISNITTVFEGHEQDDLNDESQREGVGFTNIKLNENNNVVISVNGIDGKFPEGYEFLGWYENGVKVSKDQSYELKNVDLTQKHTYTAKFKYAVEYYVRAFRQHNGASFTESELFTTRYQTYNSEFISIGGPSYIKESITHWGIEHIDHNRNDDKSDAFTGNIVKPLKVYSHNTTDDTNGETFYQAFITTDFPGPGAIDDSKSITGGVFTFTPISEKYHLNFWTLERSNKAWTYINNPMDTGVLDPSIQYKGMAMVTADITFHKKDNTYKTVTRKYNDNLFMKEDITHTYKYPFFHQDEEVDTNPEDSKESLNKTVTLQASPSEEEMKIDGYSFLGWISSEEVTPNSLEWNYIYDVENDTYCTSDINKVKPYLLSKDEIIKEAIDVYPVYAKYNVETTTNVNFKAPGINIPSNPKYTIEETETGKATVTLTPDTDTFISEGSSEKYKLTSLVKVSGNTEEIINPNTNGTYTCQIEAGKQYTFMAKYSTNILLYHLNDTETKLEIKNSGDIVGNMPSPTYNIDNYIFYGWTNESPENGKYHIIDEDLNSINIINSSSIINNSLELWPVYINIKVKVNSNIDDYLLSSGLDPNQIRNITKVGYDKTQINAEKIEGYKFIGWYQNYQDNNNKGNLITENQTYLLQKDESLKDTTYTAVYLKYYKVNYHDKNGNIIYTSEITQDENRSFVSEVIDSEGNKIETIIDFEPYQEINATLDPNEIFQNWQWEKDGTIIKWDDFYKLEIKQNMDLYPIIRTISATDSKGNPLTINNSKSANDIDVSISANKMSAYLNIDYQDPTITFKLEDTAYNSNSQSIEYPPNIDITLYQNKDLPLVSLATGKTNENGLSTLDLFGTININIEADKNETFIIQLYDDDLINEILITAESPKTLKLPYGKYKIVEKDTWSWRYSNILEQDISVSSNYNNENINLIPVKENPKWFDFTTNN